VVAQLAAPEIGNQLRLWINLDGWIEPRLGRYHY